MGTSFVLVEKPGSAALLQFSAPVGGPLATLRIEVIGLLYLLRRVKSHFERVIPLIYIYGLPCLRLAPDLQKWGRSDFWPDPRDIIRFDVIFPLLQEIHQ